MANIKLPEKAPAHGKIALPIRGKRYVEYTFGSKKDKSIDNIIKYWNELFHPSHELSIQITALKSDRQPRGRKVLDTETGFIYESISKAAHANNIRPQTLGKYLSGYIKTNPTELRYL